MEAIHLPVIECVRLTIQDTVLIGNIPVSDTDHTDWMCYNSMEPAVCYHELE